LHGGQHPIPRTSSVPKDRFPPSQHPCLAYNWKGSARIIWARTMKNAENRSRTRRERCAVHAKALFMPLRSRRPDEGRRPERAARVEGPLSHLLASCLIAHRTSPRFRLFYPSLKRGVLWTEFCRAAASLGLLQFSNRKIQELESDLTYRKQTTAPRSNREFFRGRTQRGSAKSAALKTAALHLNLKAAAGAASSAPTGERRNGEQQILRILTSQNLSGAWLLRRTGCQLPKARSRTLQSSVRACASGTRRKSVRRSRLRTQSNKDRMT
jgi:hypothetical protein